jgi:hypothetical protein
MTTLPGKPYLINKYISNKLKGLLLLVPAMFFLESCEGYRCADGSVRDKSTNLPLDSVLVEVITGSNANAIYTDTTGKFNVCNGMGGCVPDCKDITVRFSKNGYKTSTLTNPGKETIVLLEK